MRGKNMPAEHDEAIRSILPIWTGALRDESGATFAQVAAPHVRLEGSIFARAIDGREKVWASLRAGGGITDTLSFTHESAAPDRAISNGSSWPSASDSRESPSSASTAPDIDNVALHHRPLGGVLAFSAEMGRRLGNSFGPGVFYQASQAS